jgi:hypothetical protein
VDWPLWQCGNCREAFFLRMRGFFKNAWHFKDIYYREVETFLKISILFEDIFQRNIKILIIFKDFFREIEAFSRTAYIYIGIDGFVTFINSIAVDWYNTFKKVVTRLLVKL